MMTTEQLAQGTGASPRVAKVLVWDLPTRIGHWLLAIAFAVSYLSGDSEEWRLVHVVAGCAMGGVLAFRLFWGIAGTRYARFSSFLFSPRQVFVYLAGLFKGKPAHWLGHNPAGSYAIYALLLLGVAVVGSGWAVYEEIGPEWLEDAHDLLSYVLLCIVGVHVAGMLVSSFLHRENLARSMVTGYKRGANEEGIASNGKYWLVLLFGVAISVSLAGLAS